MKKIKILIVKIYDYVFYKPIEKIYYFAFHTHCDLISKTREHPKDKLKKIYAQNLKNQV